jgi:hypothetical protein
MGLLTRGIWKVRSLFTPYTLHTLKYPTECGLKWAKANGMTKQRYSRQNKT